MSRRKRIAVLGAGIMGCSVALRLARRGVAVTLVDAAPGPFSAASRWNEGKIHLGYMYSADPGLRTAAHMIEGGLWFRPLVEEMLDCSLEPVISTGDDIYLCHRDSVVDAPAMEAYLHRVSDLVRSHPAAVRYLVDVSRTGAERLQPGELAEVSGAGEILAGFRVPERSVQTRWVADRFTAAVAAEDALEMLTNTRVLAVEPTGGSLQGPWKVSTADGVLGPFSHVVNALWEGRPVIDRTVGLEPVPPWTHRYRLALFLRTRLPVSGPCAVIATGPFGDVKNYNGRDFYLSWYPAGLVAEGSGLEPPAITAESLPAEKDLAAEVFRQLGALVPWTQSLPAATESFEVAGGWVFAGGKGKLSDPSATLHQRWRYGIERHDTYLSVDTGKYSTAPWMARELVDSLTG
ncbi:FAD-dependent oxidoreductase [Pseudohaliea sp.]|uniref:NAD(P)/FAD-dependent oxidoreductase n=1 Tax=Pseudohaliea sp. TaxID=2740289 RepID=UPI0032EF6129